MLFTCCARLSCIHLAHHELECIIITVNITLVTIVVILVVVTIIITTTIVSIMRFDSCICNGPGKADWSYLTARVIKHK